MPATRRFKAEPRKSCRKKFLGQNHHAGARETASLHYPYNRPKMSTKSMDMIIMSRNKLPAPLRIEVVKVTRAESDEQMLKSWLDNLNSPHTRLNFEITA